MTANSSAFQRRYDASPFDPTDKRDVNSEAARKIMLTSFIAAMETTRAESGEDLQDIAGGLLVGLVQIMMGLGPVDDVTHGHIRAGLLELIPWAVDMSRQQHGLPPLAIG